LRAALVLGGASALGWGALEGWDALESGATARVARPARASIPWAPPEGVVPPPVTREPDLSMYAWWVAEENARQGTAAWNIANLGAPNSVEGFCDAVSATLGDTVRLFVSTTAPQFRVEAYRIGWYQGLGARLVWSSDTFAGGVQSPASRAATTNMVEAGWSPSLSIPIDAGFVPGCYLFKLVASTGEGRFVPLTIRDDTSTAAYAVMNAVTTWQAYNDWGGYSLYYGNNGTGPSFANRARIVSFDRPYSVSGAPDFLGFELPVVSLVERLALDITYTTSVDVHLHPELLSAHRALVSLGHDEYWSQAMRDGITAARDQGVNLVFLGANAAYRQIRFEASPLGPARHQVCYKSAAEDPMSRLNPVLATVNWRDAPVSRPEAQLIGEQYECNPVSVDMVITRPDSWVFANTGLSRGARLPGLVGGEYDRYVALAGVPTDVEILAHSPLTCGGRSSYADMTYYTAPSGAGVFDTGTQTWTTRLDGPHQLQAVVAITTNVLIAFGQGPAASVHPAQP
jgi:hypothetical protein